MTVYSNDIYDIAAEYAEEIISDIGMFDLWNEWIAMDEDKAELEEWVEAYINGGNCIEEENPGFLRMVATELVSAIHLWQYSR